MKVLLIFKWDPIMSLNWYLYLYYFIMRYATFDVILFKVKNLDVDCIVSYTEDKEAGFSPSITHFSQVHDVQLSVTAYLNWDIRKFVYTLWNTKEQIRDRMVEFIMVFQGFDYKIRSTDDEYNDIFDRLYRSLRIDRSEEDLPAGSETNTTVKLSNRLDTML